MKALILGLALIAASIGFVSLSSADTYPPGDADASGSLESRDALRILYQVAQLPPLSGFTCFVCMDVDSDGQTTAKDALAVLRVVAGATPTPSPSPEPEPSGGIFLPH